MAPGRTFSYNAAGQLTACTGPACTVAYDDAGRISTLTENGIAWTLAYARAWSCGRFEDGRACAILDGDRWRIGFFERGRFDVKLETHDLEEALRFFIDWVARGYEGTRADAELTRRWLEERGLQKP